MTTATIDILLDDQTADLYAGAPPANRKRLNQLISYLVGEFSQGTADSLLSLMDDMSREAQAKGLTPEILESILNDD